LKGLITASIFFIAFPSPGLPAGRHRRGPRQRLAGSVPSPAKPQKRLSISRLTDAHSAAPVAADRPRIRV